MATYKGIGFDNTNAKFRTATSADTIQFDAAIDAQDGVSVTGDISATTLTISGDGTIGGNLTVTGDLISRGAVNLVIQDSFIDQGVGNTGTTATAGGTTISLNADSGFTVETAQNFVAGVASTSNPTVQMSASSSFAAGDVMVITGSTSNDGLYVVLSVATDTVTIKGIGTVAVNASTPWAQNQFVATTGDSASAYKVDLKVLAVADGTAAFKDSVGSAYSKGAYVEAYHAAATESDFSANAGYTLVGAASTTLQGAYSGGATITTSGSTDIAFTLSSGNFTASGAGAVSLTPTGASSFTSGGALTLTGGGASTWSTTSGALTITSAAACTWSTSAGNLALTGAGGLELSDGTATLDLDGSGALTDTGLVSVSLAPTGGVDFSAGAASIFDVTGGNLTLSTTTSGTLAVSSAGTLDIDGVAVTIDSTGALDITAADGQALSINHGGGSALNINATGQIDLTGESASAVNIGSTAANLSLSTTTSGEIDLTSAGAVDINATGNVTIDGADVTIDAVNAFSIDAAAGASNVSVTGANLTLSTTTSGNVIVAAADNVDVDGTAITIDATSTLSIDSADTTNLTMTANDGANKTMTISASNGGAGDAFIAVTANKTTFSGSQSVVANGADGTAFAYKSGQNIVAGVGLGDLVYISSSGYDKANATSASTAFAVAIAAESGAATNGEIVLGGNVFVVTMGTAPSAVGVRLYLDTTAGQATETAPTGSGNVVYQIGFALSTSASFGSAYEILFQPQFIAEIS
jgi:hypothetical protein